ncbi:hypothetical protein CRG98_001847 [Punica granatum]|uniref:Uncharacterized protein n=1 Tax=Punica granatum TaxID=22663 RepID=A0A2I0LAK5_PUNGR|nr:hypothetical protein CRG98_001847 [Punica granatum]
MTIFSGNPYPERHQRLSPSTPASVIQHVRARHPCPSPAPPALVIEHARARHQRHQRSSSSTPVPVTSARHPARPCPSPVPVTSARHRARRPSPCLAVPVRVHPCTRIFFQGFYRVTRLSNTSPTLSSYPEAR